MTSTLAVGAGCNHNPATPRGVVTTTIASVDAAPVTPPAPPSPQEAAPRLVARPDVAALVAKVKPSVVNVTVERVASPAVEDGIEPGSPFEFFFLGRPGAPSNRRSQRALGSGFIIDAVGHVVTNEHVVDCADIVKVKLVDEREFKAKVMGRDKRLDLAVLKTEGAKDLPYAALGSRSSAAAPSAPSARSWPRCRTSRPRGRGRCPSHPGAASSASSSS